MNLMEDFEDKKVDRYYRCQAFGLNYVYVGNQVQA